MLHVSWQHQCCHLRDHVTVTLFQTSCRAQSAKCRKASLEPLRLASALVPRNVSSCTSSPSLQWTASHKAACQTTSACKFLLK